MSRVIHPSKQITSYVEEGSTIFVVWGKDIPKDGSWEYKATQTGPWQTALASTTILQARLHLVRERKFNVDQLPYVAKLSDGSVLVPLGDIRAEYRPYLERQKAARAETWLPLDSHLYTQPHDSFVVRVRVKGS